MGCTAAALYAVPHRYRKAPGLLLAIILALLPVSAPVQRYAMKVSDTGFFRPLRKATYVHTRVLIFNFCFALTGVQAAGGVERQPAVPCHVRAVWRLGNPWIFQGR
jgi:hypothetical protein